MKIIALSAEMGSYGDEIAAMVAKEMNFHVVDQAEVHRLAQDCDDEYKNACSLYEREEPKGFRERFFFDRPSYVSLFQALNYELAARGDVIIRGRGAQIVLRDIPGVVRVRVVAPMDLRVKRVMEMERLTAEQARDQVVRHGERRRAMMEAIFNVKFSDWTLYDLIINTEKHSIEDAAHVLKSIVERTPSDPEQEVKDLLHRLALAKRVESSVRRKVVAAMTFSLDASSPAYGSIVLDGLVEEAEKRTEAEKIARSHPGVTSVENNIRVLPPRAG